MSKRNTETPLQTRRLKTLLGHAITVFRDDHVGDKIATQGLYEKDNLLFLLQLLKELGQPVVMDIGANIGNHSLAFATQASKVLSFEPLPQVFSMLVSNIEDNRLHSIVQPFNIALSDEPGSAAFYMDRAGNVGASSFEQRSRQDTEVLVEKQRGDDVLAALGIDQVDFVKIDVEAHEAYVLAGLAGTLTRCKPIITMEWNDPLTVERLSGSPMMGFLEKNYQIFVLGSNYDRQFWSGRRFSFLRRKLTRLFRARQIRLYLFDRNRLYKNLLLIPKNRMSLLGHSIIS